MMFSSKVVRRDPNACEVTLEADTRHVGMVLREIDFATACPVGTPAVARADLLLQMKSDQGLKPADMTLCRTRVK